MWNIFQSDQSRFITEMKTKLEDTALLGYVIGITGIGNQGHGSQEDGLRMLEETRKNLLTTLLVQANHKGFSNIDSTGIVNNIIDDIRKRISIPEGKARYCISRGKAVDRMAMAFCMSFKALDAYAEDGSNENLVMSVWFYFLGVMGSIRKWRWNPLKTKIRIHSYVNQYGKISLINAVQIYNAKYKKTIENCEGPTIDEILDAFINGDPFLRIWGMTPTELKKKLLP